MIESMVCAKLKAWIRLDVNDYRKMPMTADSVDRRLGANLRRVILGKGFQTVQAFHSNSSCPLTLDCLYKRIRGVHSIRLRDVLVLAETLDVPPDWLSQELVKKAGDRDQFILSLADDFDLTVSEVERRLMVHLEFMDWRQFKRLYELDQITL